MARQPKGNKMEEEALQLERNAKGVDWIHGTSFRRLSITDFIKYATT
jgi:hypothetical protein